MEIIIPTIVAIIVSFLLITSILGLPNYITYRLNLKRYQYMEPAKLFKFKKAIFNTDFPLPETESFELDDWNYYPNIRKLANYSEKIELNLFKYDVEIIWHWIRTHNKELRKKKKSPPVGHRH